MTYNIANTKTRNIKFNRLQCLKIRLRMFQHNTSFNRYYTFDFRCHYNIKHRTFFELHWHLIFLSEVVTHKRILNEKTHSNTQSGCCMKGNVLVTFGHAQWCQTLNYKRYYHKYLLTNLICMFTHCRYYFNNSQTIYKTVFLKR